MTPTQMESACNDVIASYKSMDLPYEKANITLVTPRGWKPPPKFPRGYLLQVKEDRSRLWHFPAVRVLAWLRSNNLLGAA
ncbi:hypothetical protein [Shinella zoogloeoides]|uniref:hypothetical protein n=1 Tax=Shinella zoogloeoides TaxID=352475 RepID=UPI001F575EA7|nr:hypothetical protein [Shinella zoogloeoides]